MTRPKSKAVPRAPRAITRGDVERLVHGILEEAGLGRSSMEIVSKNAAQAAVKETLMLMGVDMSEPLKVQEQFYAVRGVVAMFADREFQADLQHVRSLRRNLDTIRGRGLTALITAIVMAVCGIFAIGIRGWL